MSGPDSIADAMYSARRTAMTIRAARFLEFVALIAMFVPTAWSQVTATVETVPVPNGGDAADDPALWIHPTNPSLSLVIGTDKTAAGGLAAYNLNGTQQQFVTAGALNNVDLRYNFMLGGNP